jgi:hypothetical protein
MFHVAYCLIHHSNILLQELRNSEINTEIYGHDFIIKATRCTNFPNLLRHENLHVSGSSSAHHKEFIHCTLGTGICHISLKTAFEQDQVGTAVYSE